MPVYVSILCFWTRFADGNRIIGGSVGYTVLLYFSVELAGSPYASQGRLLLWLPPAAKVNVVLDEGNYKSCKLSFKQVTCTHVFVYTLKEIIHTIFHNKNVYISFC